jgi:hypothetical protein
MPWELERLKALIRSIGSSLNRRLSVVWSRGFTRTVSIFGKVAVIASVARVVAGPCACAASDHAAAAPPNRLMNSHLMVSSIGDAAASRSRPAARGAKTDRVELAKVIARLEPNDVFVVTRLDRLARSTRDLLNVIDTVTKRGAGFKSLKDTWADTTIAWSADANRARGLSRVRA